MGRRGEEGIRLSRAILTFAVGRYTELLDIVRPSFVNYADKHGYDYIERQPELGDWPRHPSWFRVPILQELLPHYDEILLFGCDLIVLDNSVDVASLVPDDCLQAMVQHSSPWGMVPNADMWYMRRGILPYINQMWDLTQYLNHPWWEQAALLHLMGYEPSTFPLILKEPTELYGRTHFLPLEWNSHESIDRHDSPRIAHATHGDFEWRRGVLARYKEILDG